MHVGKHGVEAGRHDAERPAGEHRALVVEARHQHLDAPAFPAEDVLRRHFAIAKYQLAGIRSAHAELVELLRGRKPFHAFLDNEGSDGLGGFTVDDQDIRVGTVGDPHLVAVEKIVLAARLRPQPHADHVRARAGLRHRQRADVLARNQLRQVFFSLRIAAVAPQLIDAEVGVGAVREAHRGRGAADFLHRHDVREIAHVRAAEFFLDRDPEQAQVAEFPPQVRRKLVAGVDLGGARRDLPRGEIAYRVSQQFDGFAVREAEERVFHGRWGKSATLLDVYVSVNSASAAGGSSSRRPRAR